MELFSNPIVSGLGSFGLLAFASWCVGEGGEILGQKYDASIIGGLLIAWLNTAPETIFFVSALRANNPRFAIGAVSGSTIVVGTVAIGISLYLGSRARKGNFVRIQPAVKKQALVLAATSFFPLITALFGYNWFTAVTAILAYCAFLVHTLLPSKKATPTPHHLQSDLEVGVTDEKSHRHRDDDDSDDDSDDESEDEQPLWKGIGYLAVGGILIFSFSEPFINAISGLAVSMDINPTLLAFFLAPIASEMPEILESISLSIKGNMTNINIAFSNLIGGTITKTTLLMGIFSIYGITMPLKFEKPNFSISLLLMLLCSCSAGFIGYFTIRQTKVHAYILFGLFAFTCLVQYMANSHFGNSLLPFADEAE